jgi:uncharacterized protein
MPAEPVALCGGCKRPLRAGTRFCPGCGRSVDGSAPAPQRRAEDDTVVRQGRFADYWGELKRIGWLYGLLLALSLAVGLAMRADRSPWLLVGYSGASAAIILAFAAARWRKLLFLFKLHAVDARRWLGIVGACVLFVVTMAAYFAFLEKLGVPFFKITGDIAQAGWPLWSALVLISLMPAVFEELAFRGVIQSSLERIFNARDAWLIQAALFSLMHLSPIIFPSHFAMGLCFGLIRMWSRSLYPGMLLHGAWNALVVLQEWHG